ncbi:MAG: aldehyde dehydrogenase family protein, partial [Dehalococcoidia bacterium]|nr:aldehyde dehydrogenase family protein [Dehalococcoidia bacterium]
TGNAMVLKPPTQGAFCGLVLQAAADAAGIPPGVLQVVTGRGSDIGDYLTTHPAVAMVSFTGSTEMGVHIAKQVGMVPLQLELGGKDAAIVLADADLDRAASEIIAGAYAYSGQRCTAVKRVLVTHPVADALVERLKKGVDQLTVGAPQDGALVTPLIDEKSAIFVEGLIIDAVTKGARPYPEVKRVKNLVYPVLVDYVTPEMPLAWEEPFGPVLPILRVRDAEEAVRLSNMSQYGLQAAVFTKDMEVALRIAEELEVGTVHFNGRPARGPDHFPFLGVKASGMGTQGVRASMESMTRVKSVVFNIRENFSLEDYV